MKALKLAVAMTLAFAGVSWAGGIQGRVTNRDGAPLSGVTISIKGYGQSVTTNGNGEYVLVLPPGFDGARVIVRVNGITADNILVPPGAGYSTLLVTLIRS